jgi:integrase
MAKSTYLLDDLQIKHWINQGIAVARSDGEGLTFTLSSSGTATWVLRYRIGAGRRKELTLGNYPDIALSAARKLARQRRAEIDQGKDPAAEKKIEKMRSNMAWTVNNLINDFKEKRLTTPPLAEKTVYYRKRDVEHVIKPKLGSMEVRKISPADIVHMLESAKRSWTVSKRILTSTKKLFEHACGKRLIDINPCLGINLTSLMGARPPIRKRVMLTEIELRALLTVIDDIGVENGLAFRILLATCVRSVELTKARWEHINFDLATWWVPDESVKTRNGFLVPISPNVAGWFLQLKDLAGESPWVLPARTERRRRRLGETHICNKTLWSAITRAFRRGDIEIRRFTPHDTRSTAKGHMRNMGISREISEIALNHVLPGMEGIYDVREEIPERRHALERWAAFIDACESGRPWNVVRMNKEAA